MRVAVITQWYSEGLGYSENLLPAALARAGAEVHILAGQGQVYAHTEKYDGIYRDVLGEPDLPCGTYATGTSAVLHRVGSTLNVPNPGVVEAMLADLAPDIVQTFAIVDMWSLASARFCKSRGVPLFTENHVHESVIPRGPWQTPRGWAVGVVNRFRSRATAINDETVTCFAISDDTYRVANRRFGVPRSKLRIQPLGVDTDVFHPAGDEGALRASIRSSLGIDENEIACVYTGRLSPDKAPHLLAESVEILRAKGVPARAIFVGAGDASYVDPFRACEGTIVLPFRPTAGLPEIYQASDIGVWPREESTSQLDAMACGLPIVVSEKVSAAERLGVGATFREGSAHALAGAIASLCEPSVRRALGEAATQRIASGLSWSAIARGRLAAYEEELSRRIHRSDREQLSETDS